ncbi:hypothetical protein [Klebsiella aerogenes]|uniref:hypothetical protein n=1 Tax=Klebsiella aerogenes TaxID=548 RepID=UPI0038905E19|nr:hypothetical protein [Klebsiella aerogenes]
MINKRIASLIAGVLVVSAIQPIAGLMGSNRCYIFDISHFYTDQKAKEYSAKTIDAATKAIKSPCVITIKRLIFIPVWVAINQGMIRVIKILLN